MKLKHLIYACLLILLFSNQSISDPIEKLFESHDVCELHYYHCNLNNYQLWMANSTCITPDCKNFPEATCKPFADGPEKRLWKPVSENTGKPVVLLPANYWTEADKLEIVLENGNVVPMRKRNCCPNGNRAHYDVPNSLVGPIKMKIQFKNCKKECFVISDPSKRVD
jgi:hypothetical protein